MTPTQMNITDTRTTVRTWQDPEDMALPRPMASVTVFWQRQILSEPTPNELLQKMRSTMSRTERMKVMREAAELMAPIYEASLANGEELTMATTELQDEEFYDYGKSGPTASHNTN